MKKRAIVTMALGTWLYAVKALRQFFTYVGGLVVLFIQIVRWIFSSRFRGWQMLEQMRRIGVASFPIVFLISLFTGMVLALQSAYQMQKMSGEMYIATLIAFSITRELGPVLTALIIAGRCGAAITAELGTMKVTEQVDALETMSASPVEYLIVPRFLALVLMLPLLTIYADFFGIVGGYLVGVFKLGITHAMYVKMTFDPLSLKDIFTGLFKSMAFAVIICVIACFEGLNSEGGAEGVGMATTSSVVRSFILIVVADCFFTALFYVVMR